MAQAAENGTNAQGNLSRAGPPATGLYFPRLAAILRGIQYGLIDSTT